MKSNYVFWHATTVPREHRQMQNGHRSATLWFTGFSDLGESTLAHAVEDELYALGCRTYVLNGNNVRHGFCGDLGFSVEDRTENIRRISEVVKLMIDAGVTALTAFISPFRAGEVKDVIISSPYKAPLRAELVVDTANY